MTARTVESLATGLRFPEAPRWHEGALWFSDMVGRRVCRLTDVGTVETVATLDDMPGGLGFLADGSPLVVGMTTSTLYVLRDGAARPWLDLTEDAHGHLDDMVVDAAGVAWVGGVGHFSADGPPPTDGRLLRVTSDRATTTVATDVAFPNGSAVSPDGRSLLVSETMASRVLAFTVTVDGALTDRRVFAELPGLHPDGLTLDAEGAVWVGCYAESQFARVEDGGRITEVIPTGTRWATGVTLGGADGRTLFLTSSQTTVEEFFAGTCVGQVDAVRVDVPAAGH